MHKELTVSAGQYSDKGRKPDNQDFHGLTVPKDALLSIKGIAMAMADGISSSEVSHIASETAVKTFLDDYYCTSEAWSVKGSVERVLNSINSWLYSQTLRSPQRYEKDKGYVCTISALVVKNQTAHVFHAGDTRVYRLNGNGLELLTNDHRLWVTQEQSFLSRALGVEAQCSFDYRAVQVKQGDIFIVTTDGVYEFVGSQAMIGIIKDHPNDLNRAARLIVEHAFERGSDDNLSIQVLRVDQLAEKNLSAVKQRLEQLPLPPALEARVVFDGYTIIREIHVSSRSHVYVAQDNASQKRVVLKTPSIDSREDMDHLQRFLMEEWIARRINSAHVLKADLPDRERNYIYTVFEFIEGKSLAQWAIDNPRPDMEKVRGIVEQVARGLHAFHRMEMLHQDLRPENIMIDTEGTVKLIDFGSVSVAGVEETYGDPDSYLLGTALYSAPEYFLGQPGSTRSDLFSLGVITYFLLSGRYPYDTDVAKAKTLSRQKKLWYRSVLDEDREIPAWVDEAICKAVQPLPEQRYEEIFEFTLDLRRPGKHFLDKTRPPLLERNPVAFWQCISLILGMVIVYLLGR